MGNCCSSTGVPCQSWFDRCWDCIAAETVYISRLKNNVTALRIATDELRALKLQIEQRLVTDEGPITKRLPQIENWLTAVDREIAKADELLTNSEQEIKKLCLGGCCSMSCTTSIEYGKSVDGSLTVVRDQKQKGSEFLILVGTVKADREYLRQLDDDLKKLQTSKDSLKVLKDEVLHRIHTEEQQHKKTLKTVEDWVVKVEEMIVAVDDLIANGPQEIDKLRTGVASSLLFRENVTKGLADVYDLQTRGDNFAEIAEVDQDYIRQLQDDLVELHKSHDQLIGVNDEVIEKVTLDERQQKKRLPRVGEWLKSVQTTMTEADALLSNGRKEIDSLLVGGCCTYRFAEIVAKKQKELTDLIARGNNFTVVAQRGLPEPGIERATEPTVGLDTMFERVWSCLMEDEMGIMGLYGMGGVGKTSLLTKINNKLVKTRGDFDFVIWVVVSKELRLVKVQEEIARKIGIFIEQWKNRSFIERAEDIFNILHRKKFVLLLDDVWETVDLIRVGVPLPSYQNGSKVIFTTRSVVVCSQMEGNKWIKVEPLDEDNAWTLFRAKVGDEALSDCAILSLAKDVAKECDGLPLALITIGRAMADKRTPKEWKDALEDLQASSLQRMEDEVHPILKFSYDSLKEKRIKSCFLYCALYPEDFRILKEELINYWVCEKFWEEHDNEVAHKKGREIIRTLISACLLEDDGEYVRMHDVLRDMALWIAMKFEKETENCFVKAGAQLIKAPEVRKWEGIRRMSLMENSIEELKEVPRCPNLWTLILCRNPRLRNISGDFFQHMQALLVLDLSNSGIQTLPQEISGLLSLQHLNLSHTRIDRLPNELQNLKMLKCLNLEHNSFLAMIPRKLISSFKYLLVLKMFHCGFFYEEAEGNMLSDSNMLVEELQDLEHLKVLTITISYASALKSISTSLSSCVQTLSLEHFSDLSPDPQCSSDKGLPLDISPIANMEHLETLHISAMQYLKELKVELGTSQEPGSLYNSSILRGRCFDSLQEVSLEFCPRLQHLGWLVLVPNLTILRVTDCEKMEEIISDGSPSDVGKNIFERLEELVLEELPRLKSICQITLHFPRLKRVKVVDCPMLKELPLNSKSAEGSKIIIEAEEHWWNGVDWKGDAPKIEFRTCPPRTKQHHPFYLSLPMKLEL